MDQGRILEEAPPEEFFAHPKNERTKEFLSKGIVNFRRLLLFQCVKRGKVVYVTGNPWEFLLA